MRLPDKETTIYVNPAMSIGGSNIVDVPMNGNIVYGQNPNLVTNEYGQTVVNPDIPMPINATPLTPIQQVQQTAQDLKDAVVEIITPTPSDTPKKDFGTIIADTKALETAKLPANKPTTNYLLYGAIGVGAVVILMGILKK